MQIPAPLHQAAGEQERWEHPRRSNWAKLVALVLPKSFGDAKIGVDKQIGL